MAEELQDARMLIKKLENELHLECKFVSELENGFFDVAEQYIEDMVSSFRLTTRYSNMLKRNRRELTMKCMKNTWVTPYFP